MWRHILIILGTVLTVLMFFGLTGRQLSEYAKGAITKRSRIQIAFLISVIAITPAYIFVVVWRFEILGLAGALAIIALILLLWGYALIDVWKLKLSQRGEKVANLVRAVITLAMLSLLITDSMLSDTGPLWQKLAPPLGGFGR